MNDILYRMHYSGAEWPVWRVNLHTRTNRTDGIFSPENVRNLYGVDGAIGFADPGTLLDASMTFHPFVTILPGIEWSFPGPRGTTVHLLVYGVKDDFPLQPASLDEAFDVAGRAGCPVYVAHPYLDGLRATDLLAIGRFDGIEIYNASARLVGKEYSLNTWDNLLDGGMLGCQGIATDGFRDPGSFRLGWTMLCAKDNSAPALLEALKAGRFYSSQGPVFHAIEYRDRHFHAEFSTAVEALLIGNSPHVPERWNGVVKRSPSYPWWGSDPAAPGAEAGPDYASPTTVIDADLDSWSDDGYVRCQIRDAQGRYAWSQPFRL